MNCPVCNTELSGKQKYCSGACRVKASRKKEPIKFYTQKGPSPKGEIVKESPEDWLARRIKETGSKGWHWVKTGTPAGSGPSIKLPIKWELSDIDHSRTLAWDQDEAKEAK